MDVRRNHYIVELLSEHGGCEEGDGAQGFRTRIGEVVPHGRRNDENIAGSDLVNGAALHAQFAGAGENILRLLSRIRVPTEPPARFDLIDDGR